eukprot:6175825-Pleurochrysis_carterae.AAC.1
MDASTGEAHRITESRARASAAGQLARPLRAAHVEPSERQGSDALGSAGGGAVLLRVEVCEVRAGAETACARLLQTCMIAPPSLSLFTSLLVLLRAFGRALRLGARKLSLNIRNHRLMGALPRRSGTQQDVSSTTCKYWRRVGMHMDSTARTQYALNCTHAHVFTCTHSSAGQNARVRAGARSHTLCTR